jgi:hypothetical protein
MSNVNRGVWALGLSAWTLEPILSSQAYVVSGVGLHSFFGTPKHALCVPFCDLEMPALDPALDASLTRIPVSVWSVTGYGQVGIVLNGK